MTNRKIATVLRSIADYLEMDPLANQFRIRAYRKASLVIDNHPTDVSKLNLAELKALPGVGKAIAEKIHEYVATGQVHYLDELRKKIPVKLEELTRVPGIGPKTVKRLYFELGIKNLAQLKRAAETGKIAQLAGFGQKSQEKILDSIRFTVLAENKRTRLDQALSLAQTYINYLKRNDPSIVKLEPAGSLRRRLETVGDIDLLAVSALPQRTIEVFTQFPQVDRVINRGETKASVWLQDKIQVDLRVVPPESYGAALQYFTGSKAHGVRLRKLAMKKGYKLNEYGLFLKSTHKRVAGADEPEIYQLLLGRYIEPELREDEGEIELALTAQLPKLLDVKDISGDLHLHTTFSDGSATINQMVEAAIAKGYQFIGISDHLGKLVVAQAVTPDEFTNYLYAVREAREKYRHQIQVLAGGEVSITPSGKLDFPQRLLKKLDYVIASVHSAFRQEKSVATRRLLRAIDHPLVSIIGHPTGRLLGQRAGLQFDATRVFTAAAERGVALEINSLPSRLDLSYSLARLAKKLGVKLSINTDAHSVEGLDMIQYGVWVARKAGLEKQDLFQLKM